MSPAILAAMMALNPIPVPAPPLSNFETIRDSHPVDNQTQADEVRIRKDDAGRMTVPVTVAGRGPWRFLVDTGADRTTISSDLASALQLVRGEPAQLHSVTSVHTVETANVPHLELSKSEVHNLDAPLLNAADMGADGILGVDSLRSQRVMFDFEKNLMSIAPARDKDIVGDRNSVVVYGRLRNGRLVVTDADAEGSAVTVVLDTGSDVSIGNEELRNQLVKQRSVTAMGSIQLKSVTGEMLAGTYSIVKKMKMGDVTLSNLVVVFADAHIFQELNLRDKPAILLGMNAMRAFKKVSIDFEHKKLRVIIPEDSSLDSTMLAANAPAGVAGIGSP